MNTDQQIYITLSDDATGIDEQSGSWSEDEPSQLLLDDEEIWGSGSNFDLDGYRWNNPVQLQPVQLLLPAVAVIILLISMLGVLNRQGFILDQEALPTEGQFETEVTNGQRESSLEFTEPAIGLAEQPLHIAPFFEESVRYWEADIVRWGERHNLDPNIVATVMQIESCGHFRAVSRSGALGLFQVMPFHFQAGEDGFDPETNALRGMNYLAERLIQTNGEVGHAFAGYNGGHVAAAGDWNSWADETQRYYRWTTGVYQEAIEGKQKSETLEQWLAAGGASLCAQAKQQLGLE